MIVKLTAAARGAMAQALIDALDTGAGPCLLKFYTGVQPAGPSTAISTQTLLGTLTCSDPVATQAGGVITFNAITQDAAADAGGTATWVRLIDASGNAFGDFDVTDNAGAGVCKINTTTIVAGGPIQISSFTITLGGA